MRKEMYRPSTLIEGQQAGALLWLPSLATETRVVVGVQPLGAPMQVSLTKTSNHPLVSLGTRFVPTELNATNRLSPLIAALRASSLDCVPSLATETGTQPTGAPMHVSRRKTSAAPLVCVLPGNKFVALESKAI